MFFYNSQLSNTLNNWFILSSPIQPNNQPNKQSTNQNGSLLEYADESLKRDKEIVMEAVKDYGLALGWADNSLKRDKEIVLAAVKQGGYSLEYADESLKRDKEFVLEAVKENGQSLRYADDSGCDKSTRLVEVPQGLVPGTW